jgi:hypothetical protein
METKEVSDGGLEVALFRRTESRDSFAVIALYRFGSCAQNTQKQSISLDHHSAYLTKRMLG